MLFIENSINFNNYLNNYLLNYRGNKISSIFIYIKVWVMYVMHQKYNIKELFLMR